MTAAEFRRLDAAAGKLRAQRDQARSIAVALEQQLADVARLAEDWSSPSLGLTETEAAVVDDVLQDLRRVLDPPDQPGEQASQPAALATTDEPGA